MGFILPGTDDITSLLTSFLDVQSRRAGAASGSITPAETPDYAVKEFDLFHYLRRAADDAFTPHHIEVAAQNLRN